MTQVETLYELQQIDLQIIANGRRLKEITAAMADSEAVKKAEAAVKRAQDQLTPLRTKVRDLELEIQSTNQKHRATEERLYSGSVKNPKELQDMQHEIEALKKRQAELEDRLLETMVQVEDAETVLTQHEDALNAVRAEWEVQHSDLLTEQAELDSQNATLTEQRRDIAALIRPENMKLYNSLRPQKANQPISVLRGDSCSMCGIEQTRTLADDVRRGQTVIYCINCGRILVDARAVNV
jgi:hypothetical protein